VLSPGVNDGPDCFDGVVRPRTAAAVSVAPAWRWESGVQFAAVPDAFQSRVVGVGSTPSSRRRLISSGSVTPSLPSRSGIEREPFVASEALGVGSDRRVTAPHKVSLPRMNVGPRDWKSDAIGVGSIATSSSVLPDFVLFREPTCRPLCAIGVGSGCPLLCRLLFGRAVGVGIIAAELDSRRPPRTFVRSASSFERLNSVLVGVGSMSGSWLPRPRPLWSLATGVGNCPAAAIC